MSREVRRVPPDWEHPKNADGRYQPMHDKSFEAVSRQWQAGLAKWNAGERPAGYENVEFREYFGDPPDRDYYRPEWPAGAATHYQMYETTSEGTPISPVFTTPEELAHWLVDNKASAFAGMTATYEQWLRVCKGGWAPSGVYIPGEGMQSGVAALTKDEEP